jgi:GalNAc-alpha-(1->4)-GalNAc-alpha-(1->3)-diNAcBac-PP-undecaprenol alpha-1,4-N-acetyl-D-galactosaminyltransferase
MSHSEFQPKRIALTIHAMFGGGAERLMSQLACRWADAGHQVHLVTWSAVETDRYQLSPNVIRVGLDLMQPSRGVLHGLISNMRRVRRLRATIQSIQPDLVLSFCDQMNIVALQAAKGLKRLPLIVSEHSDPAKQRLSRLWEYGRDRNYPKATACVALTDGIAHYMTRWILPNKIRVIPPAISPPQQPDIEFPRRQPIILAVGRLSHEKGIDLLIEAWGRIHNRLPNWKLQIAGSGPLESKLRTQANGLERIEFLGWVDNAWSLYNQASLFVLPSRYEGFPVAMVEALSQGLPVIATRCSDAIRLFENEKAIHAIAADQVESMATEVEQLTQDTARRQSLGQAGRIASQHFHWDQVGPLWDELLDLKK